MNLRLWLGRFLAEKDLRRSTEKNYLYAVKAFEAWLGRRASVRDLAKRVNDFLRERGATGSRYTTKSFRGALLSLLTSAAEAGLLRQAPRVRLVRCPAIVPQHVHPAALGAILAACERMKYGKLQLAAVRIGWETGLRRANILRLRWSDVDQLGVVRVVQEKTGRVVVAQLSPETLALCRAIKQLRDPRLVPWPLAMTAWGRWFIRLRKVAGIETPKIGLQSIRRTAADRIAKEQGIAAAVQFLGHSPNSGEQVARRFYLSPESQGMRPILPPPIQ